MNVLIYFFLVVCLATICTCVDKFETIECDVVIGGGTTAALAAAGTPASPNRSIGRRYAGPEEAEVTEFGAKILLPSGYLNIALFDQTIDGFQSNTFIGTGFVLANAGSQSADGYEFDLVYSPVENIEVRISIGITAKSCINSIEKHKIPIGRFANFFSSNKVV